MSYCRFGDNSDVYLYFSINGYICCCMCKLQEEREYNLSIGKVKCKQHIHPNVAIYSYEYAIKHLKDHKDKGHKVPIHSIKLLKEELRNLNKSKKKSITKSKLFSKPDMEPEVF